MVNPPPNPRCHLKLSRSGCDMNATLLLTMVHAPLAWNTCQPPAEHISLSTQSTLNPIGTPTNLVPSPQASLPSWKSMKCAGLPTRPNLSHPLPRPYYWGVTRNMTNVNHHPYTQGAIMANLPSLWVKTVHSTKGGFLYLTLTIQA